MAKVDNEKLVMEAKLSEMTNHAIHQRIQDSLMLQRNCYKQIAEYKALYHIAGEIIERCETELRRRGEI